MKSGLRGRRFIAGSTVHSGAAQRGQPPALPRLAPSRASSRQIFAPPSKSRATISSAIRRHLNRGIDVSSETPPSAAPPPLHPPDAPSFAFSGGVSSVPLDL
jgi:hypothetical protein